MWDPLAKLDDQPFDLECSRDSKGKARATATFRPWSAAERIAYEDALTTRLMDLGMDADTEEEAARQTVVKLGSMRLTQLALTIRSVTGFPETCEIELADGERETVPFDPRDERCLKALDGVTYDELRELAGKVQTPPGEEADAKAEDKGDAVEPGAGEPGDADPSPTP